jgi:hypothetical protein
MRPARLSLGRLGVAVVLVVLGLPAPAATAKGRPDLVVKKVAAVGVAATGGNAALTVTVTNRGHRRAGKSQLGLRLKGKSLAGKHLAVRALRPGRSKTLKVTTAALPADLLPEAKITFDVCADAARKVREAKESNNCTASGSVLLTEANIGALLQAAQDAHAISASTSAVYLARAAAGDPGLPAPFRLRATADSLGDHAAVVQTLATYPKLSAKEQRRIAPYLAPAPIRRYIQEQLAKHGHKSAHASAGSPCSFVSAVTHRTIDFEFAVKNDYEGISAAGDKAVVWFEKDRPQDRSAAELYAAALTAAWSKLTPELKEPLGDAARTCENAGDGRFDVYVDASIANRAQVEPVWIWDAKEKVLRWPGCTGVPAYMQIRPGLPRWAVAHELMHAIQFAYKYKSCEGYQNGWWDEGSATWAGDNVFPEDNRAGEWEWLGAFEQPTRPIWRLDADYETWVFWYFLVKTQGVGVMNKIFGALASQSSRAAVNAAIPGGFAEQFPIYERWLANGPPVGEPGFPLAKSYLGWDQLSTRVAVASDTALKLGSAPGNVFKLPVIAGQEGDFCVPLAVATPYRFHQDHCVNGFLGPESGVQQHVTLPDANVRGIVFTNGLTGKTGEHVEAWMRLADGTWKTADWSGAETKLCRDNAAEDVQELTLVTTNVGTAGDGFSAKGVNHLLAVANSCPFPERFHGTFTRVYTDPNRGTWKETVNGDITYRRDPLFPPETDAITSVPYELESGTISWTVTGSTGGVCASTFSGSGTEPATNDTSTGTPTRLTLEKVTGHAGAPDPEPKPYYYSIRDGQDPQKAPLYDVTDCNGTSQEDLVLPYFDIGDPDPVNPDEPQEHVQKSDKAALLAGHQAGTDDRIPGFEIDDTWSFTGSS